ncbi:DNA polymerase III beta subunit [Pseudoalteromonas phage C7]|uniref:RusA-like Holliday junction resolvase n=1 Tax=Pseudoalteromonas phage C7 TaxID=2510494 RepID=UPI0010174715|nr:RusA-like Holliday junction resolvase [Pseudoalteromonas phage C7]QAY18001.1 DNA polymerase III beta subunit [Pseudoalteromonas phage C7]
MHFANADFFRRKKHTHITKSYLTNEKLSVKVNVNFNYGDREMKIDSCKLRAAQKFAAVNDPRYYLCGIRINGKHIEATNGHVAVRMDSDVSTKRDLIVSFKGKIPAKAVETVLTFKKGKETAYHYDGMMNLISAQLFDIVDGKFPELDKVIPTEMTKGEFPNINSIYLKLIHDAFAGGKNDYFGAKAVSYGVGEKVVFKLPSLKNHTFGNPVIIIMPMSEEKK